MGLFDIFKRGKAPKKKKAEEKLKRPPKGALKSVSKKEKKPEKTDKKEEKKVEQKLGKSELGAMVILRPHVTEKTTYASDNNAYAFVVSSRANKILVKRAVRELYGFEPLKVRMQNMPSKPRRVRGIRGIKPGYKKAVVYLKEGDKIELT